jgi:hypothetical protein
LNWGRTHSGCYFCFFQKPIEWVRLLETHPEDFESAQNYEKISDEPGKSFTWNEDMPLCELRKPENVAKIKKRYEDQKQRYQANRKNKSLMEVFGCTTEEIDEPVACLICQL